MLSEDEYGAAVNKLIKESTDKLVKLMADAINEAEDLHFANCPKEDDTLCEVNFVMMFMTLLQQGFGERLTDELNERTRNKYIPGRANPEAN